MPVFRMILQVLKHYIMQLTRRYIGRNMKCFA